MTYTIAEIIESSGYIIAADENGCLVTWNGSNTFNFWIYQSGIKGMEGYINTNVQTNDLLVAVHGQDLALAERIAQDWLENPEGWEVCHSCRRPTDPDEWDTAKRLCVDCAESDKEGDE
jgi:hypothetical protein